jgi:hypothetical protein
VPIGQDLVDSHDVVVHIMKKWRSLNCDRIRVFSMFRNC